MTNTNLARCLLQLNLSLHCNSKSLTKNLKESQLPSPRHRNTFSLKESKSLQAELALKSFHHKEKQRAIK
jgi:hypothetical protein